MLDVPELEKRWAKYHFKKMLPRYIVSTFLFLSLGVITYLYIQNPQYISAFTGTSDNHKVIPVTTKANQNPVPKAHQKPVPKAPPAAAVVTALAEPLYEQNTLEPSFTFLEQLERYEVNYNNALKLASIAAINKKKKQAKAKKKKARPYKKPKAKTKQKVKPKAKQVPTKRVTAKPVTPKVKNPKTIVIVSDKATTTSPQTGSHDEKIIKVGHNTTSDAEFRSLIKRFNRKKKPALSLFIANKYYEQGNYAESYQYAKETLKLNGKIEDAVLLYAKSLIQLGKTEKAKGKLQRYIKQTQSIKAKSLLNKINKGTFQ